uniref:Uncharacterized protein n=1 Tax=Arundo donax TaxID=35708 RepID=A0A0A9AQZ5_ARUDO
MHSPSNRATYKVTTLMALTSIDCGKLLTVLLLLHLCYIA